MLYSDYVKYAVVDKELVELLTSLKEKGNLLYLISHKSKKSHFDSSKEFHKQAEKKLADEKMLNLFEEVFFCETAQLKIEKIKELSVDYFIDDLDIIISNLRKENIKVLKYTNKPILWKTLENILSLDCDEIMSNYSSNSSEILIVKRKGEEKFIKVNSRLDRYKRELAFYQIELFQNSNYRFEYFEYIEEENILIFPHHIFEKREVTSEERIGFLKEIQAYKEQVTHLSERSRCQKSKNRDYCFERLESLKGSLYYESLDELAKSYLKKIEKLNLIDEVNDELNKDEIILSPGDFGFQNCAVVDGRPYFHDFECSGLDHYSKLLCDYLLHPQENWSSREPVEEVADFISALKLNDLINYDLLSIWFRMIYIEWISIIYTGSDKKRNESLKRYYESLLSDELPFKIKGMKIKIDEFFNQIEKELNDKK
tara:strand:+ start:37580 stop:38863 length:1284 start_codon:yes stop_codon:yes gene_type:complete